MLRVLPVGVSESLGDSATGFAHATVVNLVLCRRSGVKRAPRDGA
jgi:hypothetical protein